MGQPFRLPTQAVVIAEWTAGHMVVRCQWSRRCQHSSECVRKASELELTNRDQYSLNLELHENEGGFMVQAACASDVLSEADFTKLLDQFANILRDTVLSPDNVWSAGLSFVSVDHRPVLRETSTEEEASDVWDPRFDDLRDILSKITRVPAKHINTSNHLAAMGIDSISAVQIVAKARRVGIRLSARDVVQSRTFGALLKKIQETEPLGGQSVVNEVAVDVPRDRWTELLGPWKGDAVDAVTITTPGMEWLIGMWQRSEGSRFQHIFGYRLHADVDASRLEAAWNQLISRHALLRSSFAYDSAAGAPLIVICKPDVYEAWSSLTVPDDSDSAVHQEMKRLVSNPPAYHRPFTKAVLISSPSRRHLVIHLHHFQYDAWSLQLLLNDLYRLYHGAQPSSIQDSFRFLRFTASTPSTEAEQSHYWRSAVTPGFEPTLFPSLISDTISSSRIVFTDYEALTDAAILDLRARKLSVSLQSLFLASWAKVQAKHSANGFVTFGIWHSGRTADVKDIERLAVPCINVLPFFVPGADSARTLDLAQWINDDLQKRTAVVEQSRWCKVGEWLGTGSKPLCNVFINIVKTAADVKTAGNDFLQPIQVRASGIGRQPVLMCHWT